MHIETDCISCIFNQALRVTKELGLPDHKAKALLDACANMLPTFRMDLTPPQNAAPMYQMMAQMLNKHDIYSDAKKASIVKAEGLLPHCQNLITQSQTPFLTATKIAVAGNVIDLASEFIYDLEEEIEKVLQTQFAIDHSNDLYQQLLKSKSVVYLADNAGENVFDRLYIQTLKSLFKDITIYYFVRSVPIINDICFEDLKDDLIWDFATVIDSGVTTPGIVVEDMNHEAKELFLNADCIISKGMGNYECLSQYKEFSLYYLLKVKCNVVAKSLALQPGDIVCKNAQR